MQSNNAAASAGVFVHPAGCARARTSARGTRVWAFAHVLPGAVVGADCNVCDGSYIEGGAIVGDRVTIKNQVLIFQGVTIEDDVFLGPAMMFTNDLRPRAHIKRGPEALLPTRFDRGATLGAGVVVVCGINIGANAFVGAGAVVAKDVPAHAFMVGNPARRIGWACTCGERLTADLSCSDCGRTFEQDPDDSAFGAASARTASTAARPDRIGRRCTSPSGGSRQGAGSDAPDWTGDPQSKVRPRKNRTGGHRTRRRQPADRHLLRVGCGHSPALHHRRRRSWVRWRSASSTASIRASAPSCESPAGGGRIGPTGRSGWPSPAMRCRR